MNAQRFSCYRLDGFSRITKYASNGHMTIQIGATATASDTLCFSHAFTKFTMATVIQAATVM